MSVSASLRDCCLAPDGDVYQTELYVWLDVSLWINCVKVHPQKLKQTEEVFIIQLFDHIRF